MTNEMLIQNLLTIIGVLATGMVWLFNYFILQEIRDLKILMLDHIQDMSIHVNPRRA